MLFLLIPLYCALSTFIAVTSIWYVLLRSVKGRQLLSTFIGTLTEREEIGELFDSLIGNTLLDEQVEELFDEKLDDLVLVFKQQIPMASTFLVGALADRLKKSAKIELLKILPDIKRRLRERMKDEDLKAFFVEKLVGKLTWLRCRPQVIWFALMACAISALLGAVQVACMHFLGG